MSPQSDSAAIETDPPPVTPGDPRTSLSVSTTGQDGASQDRPARRPEPPIACGGCAHTWTASGAAHCAACHETFSAVGLFDRHRVAAGPRGSCRPPSELSDCEFRDGMWRGPQFDGFGGPA